MMQITSDQLLAEAQAMALELRFTEALVTQLKADNARLIAENEALKEQIHLAAETRPEGPSDV